MTPVEESFDAKIIGLGRITVPKYLRIRHGIKIGDRVAFHMVIERPEVENVKPEDIVPPTGSTPHVVEDGELDNESHTTL